MSTVTSTESSSHAGSALDLVGLKDPSLWTLALFSEGLLRTAWLEKVGKETRSLDQVRSMLAERRSHTHPELLSP